jgi:mono/diheme cytochrome c family protein
MARRSPIRIILALVLAVGAALAVAASWQLGARPRIPAAALVARAGDLQVALQVGALSEGRRAIEVWVSDGRGRPADLRAVALRFSMPFICADLIDVAPAATGRGYFKASGAFFGMAGSWLADVTLQAPGGPARQARLVVPIGQPDVAAPFAPGQLPDPALLDAGRQLYVANCAGCHGAGGRGDGPRGAALSPRPTDLGAHMVAGKHSDEQTYLTISNGRPGTAMAPWGDRLSADEIWRLTAYIRSLATDRPAP